MSGGKTGSKKAKGLLTDRQREWLEHLNACQASGETMKGYARRHRISIHALYQAAKELRRHGVLPPPSRSSKREKPRTFVRAVTRPESAPSMGDRVFWRLRLSGGVTLEGLSPLDAAQLAAWMFHSAKS